MLNDSNIKYIVLLHCLLFFFSFSGVFSKFASKQDFLSVKFCLLYVGIIAILGIYAIAWQQILKHIPLTTAFCNKAVSIIWGIVWGALIFKEQVKINMIIGAAIVIIGVIIVVKSDDTKPKSKVKEVSADE
ncbi:MAG: transporter [Eubacterium sp.]|nr:transporter [Eubacterium sp.]